MSGPIRALAEAGAVPPGAAVEADRRPEELAPGVVFLLPIDLLVR